MQTKAFSHTKQPVTKATKQDKISVCDVMKNNTSKVIKKKESLTCFSCCMLSTKSLRTFKPYQKGSESYEEKKPPFETHI